MDYYRGVIIACTVVIFIHCRQSTVICCELTLNTQIGFDQKTEMLKCQIDYSVS